MEFYYIHIRNINVVEAPRKNLMGSLEPLKSMLTTPLETAEGISMRRGSEDGQ